MRMLVKGVYSFPRQMGDAADGRVAEAGVRLRRSRYSRGRGQRTR